MPTAQETRQALQLVSGAAVSAALELLDRSTGSPEERRLTLLDGMPAIVDYYGSGSAAVAADFYDDERESAGHGALQATAVVPDRVVKIRRGTAWASEPMFGEEPDMALVTARLTEIAQYETATPYRETILTNRRQDPAAVGWRRVVSPTGCPFCRMLGSRGAVYKEETAHFASHPNCSCTAQPVFVGQPAGDEATVIQYMASKRSRTPAQRAELRMYLENYK